MYLAHSLRGVIHHGGEGLTEQNSSNYGIQEAKRGIQEDEKAEIV
jgi:hypothetical protein